MTEATLLQRELWTSWASCLRAYAGVYGITSPHHAVVEVSADAILLRVDTRWARFTPALFTTSEGAEAAFRLNDDGTATLDDRTDEMDLAAEQVARTLFTS